MTSVYHPCFRWTKTDLECYIPLMGLSSALRMAASLVFSNHCEICEGTLPLACEDLVCESCQKKIHGIQPPCCWLCGRPMAHDWGHCQECRSQSLHFDRAFSATLYEGVMKSLLHAYKFKRRKSLTPFLSKTLIGYVQRRRAEMTFDSIVAVPSDPLRQRERGFNPAAALAKPLAEAFGVEDLSQCLIRSKAAEPQSLLPKHQRQSNVEGCFEARHCGTLSGRKILLVDDILTTGQTASQGARTLKNAGALSVQVLCVARGL